MDGNEIIGVSSLEKMLPCDIKTLDLSAQNLTCVPEQVANCTALQKLNLSNNKIQSLPRFLENLQNLEELIVSNNCLQIRQISYSSAFIDSKSEAQPSLEENSKEDAPTRESKQEDSIYTEDELCKAGESELADFEEVDFSCLSSLKTIDLSNNELHEFPATLCKSKSLQRLNLSQNHLRCLPEVFYSYYRIRHLILDNNGFSHLFEIPAWMFHLKRCTVLSFANCYLGSLMRSIPSDYGYYCRLITKLDLRGTGIRDFPEFILSILDLEYLWLSNTERPSMPKMNPLSSLSPNDNMIWALPDRLASLTLLTHFEISNVRLSIIPSSFCNLQNLEYFDAANNSLESLPNQFFNLVNLKYLNLSNNELAFLPNGLRNLGKQLATFKLSHNQLYDVRELEHLSALRELDLYSNRLTEIDLPKNVDRLDLAENQLCREYLSETFGVDFLAGYDEKQSKLRESLTLLEERLPLAQKLDTRTDKKSMHMNGWSSEEESLESYEENPLWDDSCEQAKTLPEKAKERPVTAEDDEEWTEEFLPAHKSGQKPDIKYYPSYPDNNMDNILFCPGDSHPPSQVRTHRTIRMAKLKEAAPHVPALEAGQFDDADSE
eukprot:TRINITY_DN2645_c0_g1_i12.p1 TRINITY_DN2645_c0_g1~~TRINITY_DN2645_c0_g1_i12.p1  ORF type:complete len:617 (-),score=125.57 TRINITY_DN2645_c0_g1_i12:888-2702(-)